MSLIDDLNEIVNSNINNNPVSSSRSARLDRISKMFKDIESQESDEQMILQTLSRIRELVDEIEGKIESGQQTRSWQESKIYVCLDNFESVMSGFRRQNEKSL